MTNEPDWLVNMRARLREWQKTRPPRTKLELVPPPIYDAIYHRAMARIERDEGCIELARAHEEAADEWEREHGTL